MAAHTNNPAPIKITGNNSAGIRKSKTKRRPEISLDIENAMGNKMGIQMSTVPIIARIFVSKTFFCIFTPYN
jgi:hypothetical protein